MGYDFIIEYKQGRENRVADALSRKFENLLALEDISISLISFPTPTWVTDLKASYAFDPATHKIILDLQQNLPVPKDFSIQHGLLFKKDRIWVVKNSPF